MAKAATIPVKESDVAPKGSLFDRLVLPAITMVWIGLVALINPIREYPLIDDGIYAYSVKSLLETGVLRFSPHVTPNLFSQVYWGALFCLPFGFSYTALSLSTLTLALVALSLLYALMREAGVDAQTASFGVLVIALNPLFFLLSFTYMTDIPFVAFTLLAVYLLVRGMKRESRSYMALGLLAAAAALLTRQLGLALFFALSLTYLVKKGLNWRNAIKALGLSLFGLGVQFSYHSWIKMTGRMPVKFGFQAGAIFDIKSISLLHTTQHFALEAVYALTYVGLFILPLLFFVGFGYLRGLWRRPTRILATIAFGAAAVLVFRHHKMPFVGDELYDFGLGTVLIRNDMHGLPTAGRAFWGGVTIVGFIAAALLVHLLISAVTRIVRTHGKNQELLLLVLVTGAIYFVPLALLDSPFDRYYLLLVPFAVLVVAVLRSADNAVSRRSQLLGASTLLLCGVFTIAGTHDFLAWNQVRWQVLRILTLERQIPPQQIGGGWEFDVWYILPFREREDGEKFLVAFSPAQGYVESERHTFRRWLPPGEGTILLLQKSSGVPATYPWVPQQSIVRQLFSGLLARFHR